MPGSSFFRRRHTGTYGHTVRIRMEGGNQMCGSELEQSEGIRDPTSDCPVVPLCRRRGQARRGRRRRQTPALVGRPADRSYA